jgi:D-serine deaminase-like pyridoxal phosphate-dependent protein
VAALDGVTEVRAGVYVFFDLVMRNVGVCREKSLERVTISANSLAPCHSAMRIAARANGPGRGQASLKSA